MGKPEQTSGRGHHGLEAWKLSRELVRNVYLLTKTFPKDEMFGLTTQIRRAAVSIPSNIAEGAARTGPKEFAQFLNIARGSLSELETQLLIATDLGYLEANHSVFDTVDRVSRLITGLHKSVQKQPAR
jgi:four helix bundle protein